MGYDNFPAVTMWRHGKILPSIVDLEGGGKEEGKEGGKEGGKGGGKGGGEGGGKGGGEGGGEGGGKGGGEGGGEGEGSEEKNESRQSAMDVCKCLWLQCFHQTKSVSYTSRDV